MNDVRVMQAAAHDAGQRRRCCPLAHTQAQCQEPHKLCASPPPSCCSPWPPLERLRGKVLVVLILGRGTSTEAKAFYEAFPDLSEPAAAWLCLPAAGARCSC